MAVKSKKSAGGGLLAQIKRDIETSNNARKGNFYIKKDQRRRVRFLSDFEDKEHMLSLDWHSKWEGNRAEVDIPCLKAWAKDCPFCGESEIRTRTKYVWQVWDYESKSRQIFCYFANRNSPVPHLASLYESYGTLLEQDFTIHKQGEGTNTTFTIATGKPTEFRGNPRVMNQAKLLASVWEAFGTGSLDDYSDANDIEEEDTDEYEDDEEVEDTDDTEEYEEEEEEPTPVRRKQNTAVKSKKRR